MYSSTKVIYNLESEAFKNILTEDLFKEIEKLPQIQKKRLILYYFYDMNLSVIAKIESCTFRAVKFSIDIALKKLYENLKNKKSINFDYKKVN